MSRECMIDHFQSIIVSVPVDVSTDAEMAKAETKGARGRYVAVERIQELENGKIEWRFVNDHSTVGQMAVLTTLTQNGHF